MRLIHCADIHLDSKLTSNFDKDKAKERNRELLKNFSRLISYAEENNVDGVLISGDLFDTKLVSKLTLNVVMNEILAHPHIDFFYLKGNHDRDDLISAFSSVPDNFKTFSDNWTEYILEEKVHIYGIELNADNSFSAQKNFFPNPSDINIVMLHGQEADTLSQDKGEIIDIKNFRNKGINYLALGHVHKYSVGNLDAEGKYCYCGCLEARGFDECGVHGFVLLDIDLEKGIISDKFVPFAIRDCHEIEIDISGMDTSVSVIECISNNLDQLNLPSKDMIKVVLKGTVQVESERDLNYISSSFEDNYYLFRLYDETVTEINYSDYLYDKSLKGAFVREVYKSDLSDAEKAEIISLGIHAIAGGDL